MVALIAVVFVCFLVIAIIILLMLRSKLAVQKATMEKLYASNAQWMSTSDTFKILAKNAADKVRAHVDEVADLNASYNAVKQDLKKEISRNKSVEIRTGFILEKIAPFLDVFKHDPNTAHHLGNPIDYVVFAEDEIIFVEVKTGKSRSSVKQRHIEKLVNEGKVRFEIVRFDYE